jgi:hypothetical protein
LLQQYDRQLYNKWNPKKRGGMGLWEVRRRPDRKTAVYQGKGIYSLEYVELDLINHVMDAPILTPRLLNKIQAMDAWRINNWAADFETKRRQYEEHLNEKVREETSYMIKQHKTEFSDFRSLLLSGFNPARLAQYWGRNS